MKKSCSKFLKIVDEKHDINFHWPNDTSNYKYPLLTVNPPGTHSTIHAIWCFIG